MKTGCEIKWYKHKLMLNDKSRFIENITVQWRKIGWLFGIGGNGYKSVNQFLEVITL